MRIVAGLLLALIIGSANEAFAQDQDSSANRCCQHVGILQMDRIQGQSRSPGASALELFKALVTWIGYVSRKG
jgi:hypothetical protein